MNFLVSFQREKHTTRQIQASIHRRGYRVGRDDRDHRMAVENSIIVTEKDRNQAHRIVLKLQKKLDRERRNLSAKKRKMKAQQDWQQKKIQKLTEKEDPPEECLVTALAPYLGPKLTGLEETRTQVGPYELGRKIGVGQFAAVFVGRHSLTGRPYAVRRLMKSRVLSHESSLENLGRELSVMTKVKHPNVVRCHQILHANHGIYMIMDLAFQDLHTYVRRYHQRLTPRNHVDIAAGILQGVEYLHSIGVAHLDIKPENILVTKNVDPSDLRRSHIQICDLGLCAVAPKDDPNGPIAASWRGTPGFVCPHLHTTGSTRDGRRADMWSVGVTILDLTNGLPSHWLLAWDQYNFLPLLQQMMLQHVHNYRAFEHEDDGRLHSFLNKLMDLDPEKRITAREALQHSWIRQKKEIGKLLGFSRRYSF